MRAQDGAGTGSLACGRATRRAAWPSHIAVTCRSLQHSNRPRERLARLGPRALAEAELLALVLGAGCGAEPAESVARRLLRSGGLRALAARELEEWRRERGLGAALAARLVAVFELARRVAADEPSPRAPIRQPTDVARYLTARYGDERHEVFGVVLLDGRHRFVREQPLSRGGWSASIVRPREVFRSALLAAAPAIILFHNHPSGDPTPSREDVGITRQVCEAGELLGIRVLDHLVVGAEGYVSMRERGLL